MLKTHLHLGLLLSCLVYQTAFAQSSAIGQPTTLQTSTYKSKPKSTNEDFKAVIGAQAAAQFYASQSTIDNGFTQQIEMTLKARKQGTFFSNAEITLGTFSTPNSFYYAAPEAYVGYGQAAGTSFTFGRKIENLSFADDFLDLGLVQPQFTMDTLQYKQQGLVSLSGHYYENGFGFHVGYNPIFLPNQGPQVTAQDGKIVSSSRWAQTPPEQFRFIDQNQEIIYAINDYNLIDVISNSGFYANVFLGQNKKRPALSATYARKPLNDIALARDTFADINTFQGNVLLTPVVLMHDVYGVDFNLDGQNLKTTISLLGDRPENKPAPDQQAMQTLSPLNIASVYLSYDLTDYVKQNFEIYGGFAQINGGEIQDINSDGQKSSFSFASSRTRFRKPMTLGAKADLFYINNRALKSDVKFIYDQQYRGSVLSARLNYAPINSLQLSFGADIIGVEQESSESADNNYLQQNKANDRLSAGVGYVF